jgi:plasmid maintenance system antidote protein VapI
MELEKQMEAIGMRLNREAVAGEIEKRLAAAGMTQAQLAAASGITQSSISDIVNCKQNLTIVQAYRLGRVSWLKVSAITLMKLAIAEIG